MKRYSVVFLFLICSLTLCATCSFADSGFSDVKSTDWFFAYVTKAANNDIVSGYPDGTFRPQKLVSYAEFISMAMQGEKSDDTHGSDHWAAPYYYAAIDRDYFTEQEISISVLDNNIPRRDMAMIMAAILSENGMDVKLKAYQEKYLYEDVDDTDYYCHAVALCTYYGCLSGYPPKNSWDTPTFRPHAALSRAEAATAMVGIRSAIDKENGVEDGSAPQEGTAEYYIENKIAWPKPTDRTTLFWYVDHFRTGIDMQWVWYPDGERTYGPSVYVDSANYVTATETNLKIANFANLELLATAKDIAKTAVFTRNSNTITVSFSWGPLPDYVTEWSIKAGVGNESGGSDATYVSNWKSERQGSKTYTCSYITYSKAEYLLVSVAVGGTFGKHSESCLVNYYYYPKTGEIKTVYKASGGFIYGDGGFSIYGKDDNPPESMYAGVK